MIPYAALWTCAITGATVCLVAGFWLGWLAGKTDSEVGERLMDESAARNERAAEHWRLMAAEAVAELEEYKAQESKSGGWRQ